MAQHPSFNPNPAYKPDAPMTMHEMPLSMRPREELKRRGVENLSDELLLAILLRTGTRGKNVTELSREILRHYGSLSVLAKASYQDLRQSKILGLGEVKSQELAAALELGRRAAGQGPQEESPAICDPAAAYRVLAPLARTLNQESFWAILLNTKNRMIGQPIEITRGLLNSTQVHPREVFNKAIRYSAASIVLAHNHPSGDATPSPEDLAITRRLIEAARILDIHVVDHVILGNPSVQKPGFCSLREQNLVSFN